MAGLLGVCLGINAAPRSATRKQIEQEFFLSDAFGLEATAEGRLWWLLHYYYTSNKILVVAMS